MHCFVLVVAFYFLIYFLGYTAQPVGSLFPTRESSLHPLHWKH